MIEDPFTMYKQSFENNVQITVEKAIEFAILSIYADNEKQDPNGANIISMIAKFKNIYLIPLFPHGTEITP